MFNIIKQNVDYKIFINGSWQTGTEYITIKSPIDGEILGNIPAMTKQEVITSLSHCKNAGQSWAKTSLFKRGEILLKAADILYNHHETIAKILCKEISKDYKSCVSEVVRTVDLIKSTVETAKTLTGEVLAGDMLGDSTKNKTAIVKRVPLGTILAISPFNYPINLAASKIVPALLMGNSVVFKPATQGAISALHMVRCLESAGLPAGILSVITGIGEVVGPHLMDNKNISMINFTGSTAVGKKLAKECGLIPLVMELGGKDPAIVIDNTNIDKTVEHIVSGAFGYSGQRCTAIKRLIVLDGIADEVLEKVKLATSKISVGSPVDNCTVTPLINDKSAKYVMSLIDNAKNKGADVTVFGEHKNNLIYPTIIDNTTKEMSIFYDEPFGPVLPIIRVANIKEAIDVANDTEYGLQASIFGSNIDEIFSIAGELEVGSVNINGKSERGPDNFPFLGRKNSGIGVQGIRYALEASSTIKSIVLNLK